MRFNYFWVMSFWILPCYSIAQINVQHAPCNQCNGTNPQYGNPINWVASDISSDYGVRIAPGGTKFHQGNDYQFPENNAILSLTSGRITGIVQNANNANTHFIKKIIINGRFNELGQNVPDGRIFAYLHIFEDEEVTASNPVRSGGFVMVRLPAPNSTHFAIIKLFSNSNHIAFSDINGVQFAYNGIQYTTTNYVNAGEYIAPVGTSGGYSPHLHISYLEAGTADRHLDHSIDPWNVLDHPDNALGTQLRRRNLITTSQTEAASYTHCEYDQDTESWNTFTPQYGDNTRNVVEIEVSMPNATTVAGDPDRYTNVAMNEGEISFLLKNDLTNTLYLPIFGKDYLGRYVLDPQGDNNPIYPSRMFNGGTMQRGLYGGTALTENGCIPFAYRSDDDGGFIMAPQHPQGHPHDYYLFPDFYLRIHDNHVLNNPLKLANFPWEARYPDGGYKMRASVTNTDTDIYQSNPVSFKIDNFKPFVQTVNVSFENQGQVYNRTWEESAGESEIKLGSPDEKGLPINAFLLPPSQVGKLIVYAWASEAMGSMQASIPSLGLNTTNGVLMPNTNGKKWKFDFGTGYNWLLPNFNECHVINFTGVDNSNNQLINFNIQPNEIQPNSCALSYIIRKIPKRTGADTWDHSVQNNGTPDGTHRFRLFKCEGFFNCFGSGGNEVARAENEECIESINVSTETYNAYSNQGQKGSAAMTITGNFPCLVLNVQNSAGQITFESDLAIQGASTITIPNLSAGVYCYELSDGCCRVSGCFEIYDCNIKLPDPLVVHTLPGENNGSITIAPENGQEPYAFTWSNSETGVSSIDNLASGLYRVTITDANGCILHEEFKVKECSSVTFSPNLVLYPPTNCGAADGSIKILSNYSTGGTPPYTLTYTDPMGVVLPFPLGSTIGELTGGEYCMIATDANGCQGRYCVQLLAENEPVISLVSVETMPACEGASVGTLTIVQETETETGFNFLWDNGDYTQDDIVSTATGLSGGEHCVTITSVEGDCELRRCFEVPILPPTEKLEVEAKITHPCPGEKNGILHLFISGGTAPYNINNVHSTNAFEFNYDGWSEGVHTITIGDYCLDEVSMNFEMKALELHVITEPGCRDEGKLNMIVDGGNEPYIYSWTRFPDDENDITDSGNTAGPENLRSGKYECVVTDNTGCKVVVDFALQNKEVEIEVVGCCERSVTGEVKFNINNPNQGPVHVLFNDMFVMYDENQSPTLLQLSQMGLPGGYVCNYTAEVDGCTESKSDIKIPFTATVKGEFVDFKVVDNQKVCVYREECNGVAIDGSFKFLAPIKQYNYNSSSLFANCQLDVFCGDKKVGVENHDIEWVRGSVYIGLVTQALAAQAATGSASLFPYLHESVDNGVGPCDWIAYCPVTMWIVAQMHGNCPAFFSCAPQAIGDDCVHQPCAFFTGYDYCGEEDVINGNPYLNATIESGQVIPTLDCKPAVYSLKQLGIWLPQIDNSGDTELLESELYDIIENYGNDPRAKCVEVVFCTVGDDKYDILSMTDINSVQLAIPDLLDHDFSNGYNQVYCTDVNSFQSFEVCHYAVNNTTGNGGCTLQLYSGYSYMVAEIWPGHFFTNGGDEIFKSINNSSVISEKDQKNVRNKHVLSASPNPFTNLISISIDATSEAKFNFEISDIHGRSCQTLSKYITKGTQIVEIPINSNLPPGVYYLKVNDSGRNTIVVKLIN